MSNEDGKPVVYRLRIPTQDNAALYGEAVWRKAEHVVDAAEELDEADDPLVTVRVPAGLVLLLEWLAQQDGENAPPVSVAERIEDFLVEQKDQLLDALAVGDHPVLRRMAEKAGTWSPPETKSSEGPFDDEIPF